MYTFSPPEDIFDVVLGCAHNKNYSGCVRNKNKNLREKGSNPMYFYAQLAKHFIKWVWLLDVSEGWALFGLEMHTYNNISGFIKLVNLDIGDIRSYGWSFQPDWADMEGAKQDI